MVLNHHAAANLHNPASMSASRYCVLDMTSTPPEPLCAEASEWLDSSIDPSMDDVVDRGRSPGEPAVGTSEFDEDDAATEVSCLSPRDCERCKGRSVGEVVLGDMGFSDTLLPKDGRRMCDPDALVEPAPFGSARCAVTDEL